MRIEINSGRQPRSGHLRGYRNLPRVRDARLRDHRSAHIKRVYSQPWQQCPGRCRAKTNRPCRADERRAGSAKSLNRALCRSPHSRGTIANRRATMPPPPKAISPKGRSGRLRATFRSAMTHLRLPAALARTDGTNGTIGSSGHCASGQLQLTGDQCLSSSACWCPAALKALPASAAKKWTLRPSRSFLKEATQLSGYTDATDVIVRCA